MKSNIKGAIAKKATESLLWMESARVEPDNDTLKIVHFSVLGQSVIDSTLNSVLTFKRVIFDEESDLWYARVETLGGTTFNVEGVDMTDLIENSNNFYRENVGNYLTNEK